MRPLKDHHLKALKLATFRLIDTAGNGDFAPLTRVKAAQLSKYKALHEEEHCIPVDVLFDAESVVGLPIVTEALAKLQGYRLEPLEKSGEQQAMGVRDLLDKIEDDTARLRLTVREGLGDGVLDQGERQDIRRRMDRLRQSLAELDEVL